MASNNMGVKAKIKSIVTNSNQSGSNDNTVFDVRQGEAMALPMWGKHFSKGINNLAQKVSSTSNFDKRFYAVAVDSIKAQLKMEVKRNIIPEQIGKKLITALEVIKKEIIEGTFVFGESAKNIYENIYARAEALAGDVAEYLNISRSLNNQVTGDFKLWIRDAYDTLDAGLQNLQAALIDKAEENVKTIFPGNVNAQLTQPISFGHHLMAYVEGFSRDRSRIKDNRKRMNESPFASGEIAGNSYNMNRDMVARILNFDKACSNSIDAINDRDYAIDFTAFATSCAIHLSRIASDMIAWHSTVNGYISFSNDFVTQNQTIPYRRDAEVLEAVRAKASRVIGAATAVASTMKGMQMEYSNDYFEICEPVMESYDVLLNSINAISALIANFTINRKQMKEAASQNFSTAMDLVDWLVQFTGATPKKAVVTSRSIIEYAIQKGKKLSLLELEELRKFDSKITEDVYSVLIPSRAMINRRSGNGSNPVQIRKAIRAARRNYV